MNNYFRCCIAISCLTLINVSCPAATVVIDDTFNNGNPTTGAAVLPVSSWSRSGNSVEDASSGVLTISTNAVGGGTVNPNQWSGSVLYTNSASSNLNLYQNTISIALREITLESNGDHAGDKGRFRFGLMGRDNVTYSNPGTGPATGANSFGQFYNSGNDGISVEIVNNAAGTGSAFRIYYKKNVTNATDPNIIPTGGSATLNFFVTGIDFTANSSAWSITLYGDNSATYSANGTWNLGDMESWGNASDGWGNSSFIMGVQNMGAATNSTPTESFNGWTTATIGSLLITASPVPEPTRLSLLSIVIGALLLRRQRQS